MIPPITDLACNLMFTPRELATVLAALLFWKEEMCPHGRDIMRPYFASLELSHIEPLSAEETEQLLGRLRAQVSPK